MERDIGLDLSGNDIKIGEDNDSDDNGNVIIGGNVSAQAHLINR
jgi:hypothetical protein